MFYKMLNWVFCFTVCFIFGFEEKTFFQKYYDIMIYTISGGGLSFLYWAIIGCIGIATGGTAFGVGVVLMTIFGLVSGLGLGSFIHIITNPSNYIIKPHIIIPVILIGIFLHIFYIERKPK